MNLTAEQIVVLAEDPGGANLVAAFILENNLRDRCKFVLFGPAVGLFEAVLGPVAVETLEVLDSVAPESSLLICATGGNFTPVVEAIRTARSRGVRSVAYLDHWTYYAVRFGKSNDWIANLPDEVWLTDEQAEKQALSEGFPGDRLKVVGDPYLSRNVSRIESLGHAGKRDRFRVLYLSEILEEAPPHVGSMAADYSYDGHSVLHDIAEALPAGQGNGLEMVIRLHPSEDRNKYDAAINELRSKLRVFCSSEPDIAADIALADLVIGAQTAALVLALEAQIPVVSYIPAQGLPCQLPHSNLRRITDPGELRRTIADSLNDYQAARR